MRYGRLTEFSLPRHILILAGTFDVYEVNTPGTRVDPGFRDRKLSGKTPENLLHL